MSDRSPQSPRSRNYTSATRSSVERCSSASHKRCASCARPWTPLAALPNFESRTTNGACMTEGAGFLEFFILEASDYVEQLDGLLLAGGSGGPDPNAVQRVARALRGTATMAKLPAFADLAAAIERIGRAMHDRRLTWDPRLRGAFGAAIDDLKKLLHSARRWSPDEDRRASLRIAELSRFAPPLSSAQTPADSAHAALAAPFRSREASNIAAGLESLTAPSSNAETGANVLRRIRALRGVAGVKDIVPFASALEATEAAGRALE